MGEAKRRRQAMGKAYGMPIAERAAALVTPVPVAIDAGLHLTSIDDGHNCVHRAALTIAHGRRQAEDDPESTRQIWGRDPRDLQAQCGMVLAFDNTYRAWDGWFLNGHVWMVDTVTHELIDPNIPTWTPEMLQQNRFKPNPGALEAPVVGVARRELLPLLDKLRDVPTIADCHLLYLPGVSYLDYVNAVDSFPAAAKQRAAAMFSGPSARWGVWAAATADRGDCTAEIIADSADALGWLAEAAA